MDGSGSLYLYDPYDDQPEDISSPVFVLRETPSGYDDANDPSFGMASPGENESECSSLSSSSSEAEQVQQQPYAEDDCYSDDNNAVLRQEGGELVRRVIALDLNEPSSLPTKWSSSTLTQKFASDGTRDWNAEFQELLTMESSDQHISKWITLRELANEFVGTAKQFGRIIISEMARSAEHKTIKPSALGGVAGGDKFDVQGIIFKFARDVELFPGMWMYGGTSGRDDQKAAKAANQELLGLKTYFSTHVPGLCVPLMALVDFRGFRLIAVARLPLGSNSLIYGSNDAGTTVHASDPAFNTLMKRTGTILNLAEHSVGNKRLFSPGDIEGHLGSDRRYYLLDFARFAPPESPVANTGLSADRRSVFFRYLRPELVRAWPEPLSSDAFTRWGRATPEETQMHNQRVTACTAHLLAQVIPQFAADFEIKIKTVERLEAHASASHQPALAAASRFELLSERLHRSGINMRHLGRVFNCLNDDGARSVVLMEMIARCVKECLFTAMRKTAQFEGLTSDVSYHELLADFLNVLLGTSSRSRHFWTRQIFNLIERKFVATELSKSFEVKKMFNGFQGWLNYCPLLDVRIGELLNRLCDICSVQIDDRILARASDNARALVPTVFATDLRLEPRVKYIGIVDMAEGVTLFHQGAAVSHDEAVSLLAIASFRLSKAVISCPSDFALLAQLGLTLFNRVDLLLTVSFRTAPSSFVYSILEQSIEKFELSLDVRPDYVPALESLVAAYAARGSVSQGVEVITRLLNLAAQSDEDYTFDVGSIDQLCLPSSARNAWSRLLTRAEQRSRLPAPRMLAGVLCLADILALACHAVVVEPFTCDRPEHSQRFDRRPTSFWDDIVAPAAWKEHFVGAEVQVRALRCVVRIALQLYDSSNNDVHGLLWPQLDGGGKLVRLRAYIERLLALDEFALDDMLRASRRLHSVDWRLGCVELGTMVLIAGFRLDGTSPCCPKFAERLRAITWPFVSGQVVGTSIFHINNGHIMTDDAISRLVVPVLPNLVKNCSRLELDAPWTEKVWSTANAHYFGDVPGTERWIVQELKLEKAAVLCPLVISHLSDMLRFVTRLSLKSGSYSGRDPDAWFSDDSLEQLIRSCSSSLEYLSIQECPKLFLSSASLWAGIASANHSCSAGLNFRLKSFSADSTSDAWSKAAAQSSVRFRELQLDASCARDICPLANLSEINLAHLEVLAVDFPFSSAEILLHVAQRCLKMRCLTLGTLGPTTAKSDDWCKFFRTLSVCELRLKSFSSPHDEPFSDGLILSGAVAKLVHFEPPFSSGRACTKMLSQLCGHFSEKLTRLTRLTWMTAEGLNPCTFISTLCARAPKIVELDLGNFKAEPCDHCFGLISSLPLQTLDVNANRYWAGKFIPHLAHGSACATLRHLNISNLLDHTVVSALDALISSLHSIRTLEIKYTLCSTQTVRLLKENCPKLEALHVDASFFFSHYRAIEDVATIGSLSDVSIAFTQPELKFSVSVERLLRALDTFRVEVNGFADLRELVIFVIDVASKRWLSAEETACLSNR